MGKILVIKGADFSQVAVGKVDPISGVRIDVVANPLVGGTVSGSGNYVEGTQITISATAAKDYMFEQWNDGNTEATRTIIVGSSAKTYIATFKPSFTLVHGYDGGNARFVNCSPQGLSDNWSDAYMILVKNGDTVSITANSDNRAMMEFMLNEPGDFFNGQSIQLASGITERTFINQNTSSTFNVTEDCYLFILDKHGTGDIVQNWRPASIKINGTETPLP